MFKKSGFYSLKDGTKTRIHRFARWQVNVLGIVEFANGAMAAGYIAEKNVSTGMKLKSVWELLRKIGGKEV